MNSKLVEALKEVKRIDELIALADTYPVPVVGDIVTTNDKPKKDKHEKEI